MKVKFSCLESDNPTFEVGRNYSFGDYEIAPEGVVMELSSPMPLSGEPTGTPEVVEPDDEVSNGDAIMGEPTAIESSQIQEDTTVHSDANADEIVAEVSQATPELPAHP